MGNLVPVETDPTTDTPAFVKPLPPIEIARAATNTPALSPDEFMLGDRKFKVLDLPYDDYIEFVSLLQPVIETLVDKVVEEARADLPDILLPTTGLTISELIKTSVKSLPEMARIVCSQTDPGITVEEVKRLGKTPMKLAQVVLKQVVRNNIIGDFADFFVQLAPLLKSVRLSK